MTAKDIIIKLMTILLKEWMELLLSTGDMTVVIPYSYSCINKLFSETKLAPIKSDLLSKKT